ncbi:hypothetical protein ACFVUW_30015 [Streptomyces xiamenensis]|uniref:hypothetical protein n=1 Tax=Streptomyces xiamenensis TaxID=408015 RepID=UPI0036EFAF21
MGTAIAAGVIAVVGTLLGSIVSGAMQRRIAQDGLAASERAALRRDQTGAVAALAAAAADHRRTSWHRRQLMADGADEPTLIAAVAAVHATRSAMAEPLARVRLLIPDAAVREAVEHLVAVTFGMHDCPDFESARLASIAAHDHLLDVAAAAIREDGAR